MFIGFFLRRIVTVLLVSGSFVLGMKADHLFGSGGSPAGTACPEVPNGN